MIIVAVIVVVAVLGAVIAWAVARADVPGVAAPVSTESAEPLVAAGPVHADDVHDLRFDQAVRGYRMGQVDAALARLADELAARDAEIATLRREGMSTEDGSRREPRDEPEQGIEPRADLDHNSQTGGLAR